MKPTPLLGLLAGFACAALTLDAAPGKESARNEFYLYDRATLEHEQPELKGYILDNYMGTILTRLTPEERLALRDVRFEFPLHGQSNAPLEFYALNGVICMPVLGLHFFHELALANAWLIFNGHNPATPYQYVGMMKYHPPSEFPGGRYPALLPTLGVPPDAGRNPMVKHTFNICFDSAVLFVLCHELAHVRFGHPGNVGVDPAVSQRNEAQADRFAVEVLRRAGFFPAGAPLFFMCMARLETYRDDLLPDVNWQERLRNRTHPLTADRIRSLGTAMTNAASYFARSQSDPGASLQRCLTYAHDVTAIARILEDESMQRSLRAEGLTTVPKQLAPRLAATFTLEGPKEPLPKIPFSGVYDGKFATAPGEPGLDIRTVLQRDGERVKGEYQYGTASGTVNGTVQGDLLQYEWREGRDVGKGQLKSTEGGQGFNGTWGVGASRDNGGIWTGRRP